MTTVRITRSGAATFRWLGVGYFAIAIPLLWPVAKNIALHLRFEDALIILRYARNLADGNGLVFNVGERVLGFSTPLQTLLSALLVAMADTAAPVAQNLMGVVALLLEGLMVCLLGWRFGGPGAAALGSLLVLNNFNLNHLYFGMEVHLFAFLVLLAHWLYLERREAATGGILGLAFLTRYDAALPALLIGSASIVERRRPPWRLVAVFFAIVTPWLVFAWSYFGTILPSTLGAKEGYFPFFRYVYHVSVYYKRSLERVVAAYGAPSLAQDLLAWWLPAFVVVGAMVLIRRDRRNLTLVLYPVLHLSVYAVIGSDPGFAWHYYVLNPCLFLLLAIGITATLRWGLERGFPRAHRERPLRAAAIASALMVLCSAPLAWHLVRSGQYVYRIDPGTQDLVDMATWLDERYGPETSLLHPSIGVIGWETDLRIIDQAGLVTPGLYYFDSESFTPIDEVVAKHRPDLVLARLEAHAELAELGYEALHEFEGHAHYRLWRRR